uniref:ARAD1D31834p n=1 Tax=Blastobotrys adeninivorans TaxID=409370 RepID=A0A060TGM4_BLAAD
MLKRSLQVSTLRQFVRYQSTAAASAAANSNATTSSGSSGSEGPASSPSNGTQFAREIRNREIQAALTKNDLAEASRIFEHNFRPERARDFLSPTIYSLFRELAKVKEPQSGVISAKHVFEQLLRGGVAPGWMCQAVIMADVAKGHPEQGIETWIKFLEAIGDPELTVLQVNRGAAVAAMIAYCVMCIKGGIEVKPEEALQLVPLKKLPYNRDILIQDYGSRLPRDLSDKVIEAVKKIRLHAVDFNSLDYLKDLPTDQPILLEAVYHEAQTKEKVTGVKLTEVSYARFISCFAQSTMVNRAFDIWNDLMKSGITPTNLGWNALLQAGALSRKDRRDIVDQIWTHMEKAGVSPDADSYATLIELNFRDHQIDRALDIFSDVQSGKIPNVNVSLKIFNIMLNGLLKNDMISEAEALRAEGKQKGYVGNIMTYNSFIRTYIDTKQYNKIETLLTEMGEDQIAPDVVTYTNLIDATFKKSRDSGVSPMPVVDDLIKDMAANGIKANTIAMTSIIGGLIKSTGDIHAARALFDTLLHRNLHPNQRTFATIIDGELTYGSRERALKYFHSMPRNGIRKPTTVYNQFINASARRGDANGALEMLEQLIEDPYTDPNRYSYYFALNVANRQNKLNIAQRIVDHLSSHRYEFDLGDVLPSLLVTMAAKGLKVPPQLLERAHASQAKKKGTSQ